MLTLLQSKLKRYIPFVKARIMDFLVYKWQIYGWILSDVLIMFLIYYLWDAIFKNSASSTIGGFDFKTTLAYIVISQITYQVSYCSDSFWVLGSEIRSGAIVMNLIRPINYRMSLVFSALGSFLVSIIMVFIPCFIIAFALLHYNAGVEIPSVTNILLYLVSCLLSLLIIDAFNFFFGLIAFFTQALFGAGMIKDSITRFLSGAMIPLAFFPLWAQNAFNFLPFASMVSTPNLILLGMMDEMEILQAMLLQVFWIVALSILARIGYKGAVKHIVSQGG